MPTVYEILNIEPTANYTGIKKAYLRKARALHPDRNLDDTVGAAERFKILGQAYQHVNNEQNAQLYFAWYKKQSSAPDYTIARPDSHIPSQTSPGYAAPTPDYPSSSSTVPPVPDGGIRLYTEEKVDVFVVIGSTALFRWDDYGTDWSPAAFILVARLLESLFKHNKQVGVTSAEAIEIKNQHSYGEGGIVVHFRVRLADLSENKVSEQDVYGGTPGGLGSELYFQVLANTKFSADDIISFQPMTDIWDYGNTVRFAMREFLRDIERWPGKHVVVNSSNLLMQSPEPATLLIDMVPGAASPLAIMSSSASPMISQPGSSSTSGSVVPFSMFPPEPSPLDALRRLITRFKNENSLTSLFASTLPKLLAAGSIADMSEIAYKSERNSILPRPANYQTLISSVAQLKEHPENIRSVLDTIEKLLTPAPTISPAP